MTDVFPDEGLDVILGVFPKAATPPANLYVGLFTSAAGGSAVPAASALLASAMGSGYAEVSTGSAPTGWPTYARQPIASSGWSSPAAKTINSITGRGVDGSQVSYSAPVAAYTPTNPICGFFVADASSSGHAVYYSNFSDSTPVSGLSIGDVIKVTPTFGFGN